jgi:membrane protease subunit HflC
VLALTGRLGLKSITHEEVAVKVSYLTGTRTVITTPGFQIYMPLVQEIFTFDRTPQKFLMEGDSTVEYNHVPYLTVRAKDGSNFWFESLEITYALIPSSAALLLEDSGPGSGFMHEWIRTYARSVLRDEFGKYSATEVADPSSYQAARIECTARLNELLQPHGIEVIDVITPKPRFDPDYETAIDERKVAEQDVKRLKEEEHRLLNERERRIAGVDKEKSVQEQSLMGELTQKLKEAERRLIEVKGGADAYDTQRRLEAEALRSERLAQAEGLRNKYEKEAEGLRARAEALEKRGEVVVREALIEKLASIQFTLIPYSRDPQPKRLEHLNADQRALISGTESTRGGQ